MSIASNPVRPRCASISIAASRSSRHCAAVRPACAWTIGTASGGIPSPSTQMGEHWRPRCARSARARNPRARRRGRKPDQGGPMAGRLRTAARGREIRAGPLPPLRYPKYPAMRTIPETISGRANAPNFLEKSSGVPIVLTIGYPSIRPIKIPHRGAGLRFGISHRRLLRRLTIFYPSQSYTGRGTRSAIWRIPATKLKAWYLF